MKKFFLILYLLAGLQLNAQTRDSSALQRVTANSDTLAANDSIQQNKDSADSASANIPQNLIDEKLAAEAVRNAAAPSPQSEIFFPKWFSGASSTAHAASVLLHPLSASGDWIFFVLAGMALLLGIIKIIFPQHFSRLFQFISRLREYKKSADSSAAKIISSLLLNLLFIITASWCLVWVAAQGFLTEEYWLYWAYTAAALAVIYLIKRGVIIFSGWIFGAEKAAYTYNYVVFSINKIAGVLLVPMIILITYCFPQLLSAMRSVLLVFALLLLAYRYLASFILMRENLAFPVFHFFLYLCAVEIMPLLLVYKLLLMNWGRIIL